MLLTQCVRIQVMMGMITMIKTNSELVRLRTFKDRFRYLKLNGSVGQETFGYDRYLNQVLYTSKEWRKTRDEIIIRDNGCDLGVEGYEIFGRVIVHHINPITIEDIEYNRDVIFAHENLIATTHKTHNALHYGDENLLPESPIERFKNDTIPWRR